MAGYVPLADYLNPGAVIPDGVTLAVDERGVISVLTVPPAASALELTDGITDLRHVSKISTSSMALSGTPGDALLEPVLATPVNPGISQPDGNTVWVDESGVLSVFQASAYNRGIVQPDGTTTTVDDAGLLHAAAQGVSIVDDTHTEGPGTSIRFHAATVDGTAPHLSVFPNLASASAAGIAAPDNTTTYVDDTGRIGVFQATPDSRGIVRPDGTTVTVDQEGTLSAAERGITISDDTGSVGPVTSIRFHAATVGGTAPNGSVFPALATSGSAGIVAPDNTSITVDGAGHISVPVATVDHAGIVLPDPATISVAADGTINAVQATPLTRGIVQPDGTTIHVDGNGIISASAVGLPSGTTGEILHNESGTWSGLAAGGAGDVLTSDGSDVSYQPARVAQANTGAVIGSRHEIDLTAESGNVTIASTDDPSGDAVHHDFDLSESILAAIRGTGTTQTFYSTNQSRALSLWNGSSNNAPPSSWYASGFSDSAWTAPVVVAGSAPQYLWPEVDVLAASEQALFRQHVSLPAGTITSAAISCGADDYIIGIYINGTLLAGSQQNPGAGQPVLNLGVPSALLHAGADNVIAVEAGNYVGTGPGTAHMQWTLSVVYNQSTVTPSFSVEHNGAAVGSEPTLNLIDGAGVSIVAADDPADARINVTIEASGGGGLYGAYVMCQDQKASGSTGGTFTAGAWQTRTLNTKATDTGNIATLSGDEITLPAGNYRVLATAPAWAVDRNALRLYDVTHSTLLVSGTSGAFASSGTAPTQSLAVLEGRFTLTATSAIALQHQCQTTGAGNGLGLASGSAFAVAGEVYATVEIWQESGGSGGGGSTLSVTDGTHTVDPTSMIDLTAGATVSDAGGGTADIAITAMHASGVGHSGGIVPDPGGTAGSTAVLYEDATWRIPSGQNEHGSAVLGSPSTAGQGAWSNLVNITPNAGVWMFWGTITLLGGPGDVFGRIATVLGSDVEYASTALHFAANQIGSMSMTTGPITLDGSTTVWLGAYVESGTTDATVLATSTTPALSQLTHLRCIRVG